MALQPQRFRAGSSPTGTVTVLQRDVLETGGCSRKLKAQFSDVDVVVSFLWTLQAGCSISYQESDQICMHIYLPFLAQALK